MITCWINGISNPRAATSVAIKILLLPFLNPVITRSLLLCLKFPWIASAECPSYFKRLTILSAPCLVFTKTSIDPLRSTNWLISSWYFLSWVTWNVSCLIFSIGEDKEPTAIRSGLLRYFSEILKILFGKVAENNNVWWSFGINFNINSIWGVKPISNIRSVSSRTR